MDSLVVVSSTWGSGNLCSVNAYSFNNALLGSYATVTSNLLDSDWADNRFSRAECPRARTYITVFCSNKAFKY